MEVELSQVLYLIVGYLDTQIWQESQASGTSKASANCTSPQKRGPQYRTQVVVGPGVIERARVPCMFQDFRVSVRVLSNDGGWAGWGGEAIDVIL